MNRFIPIVLLVAVGVAYLGFRSRPDEPPQIAMNRTEWVTAINPTPPYHSSTRVNVTVVRARGWRAHLWSNGNVFSIHDGLDLCLGLGSQLAPDQGNWTLEAACPTIGTGTTKYRCKLGDAKVETHQEYPGGVLVFRNCFRTDFGVIMNAVGNHDVSVKLLDESDKEMGEANLQFEVMRILAR